MSFKISAVEEMIVRDPEIGDYYADMLHREPKELYILTSGWFTANEIKYVAVNIRTGSFWNVRNNPHDAVEGLTWINNVDITVLIKNYVQKS